MLSQKTADMVVNMAIVILQMKKGKSKKSNFYQSPIQSYEHLKSYRKAKGVV